MRTLHNAALLLAVGTLCVGVGTSVRAVTIFDNSAHDLVTRLNPGTNEVGDEILLGSPERYLTNFSFEFWGTNSTGSTAFAGSVAARVRFYQNNGPPFNGYLTPGSIFYDSGWFAIAATPRSTENFILGSDFAWTGLFLPVTTNMTWSVQFQGMGATDAVGVDIYSPPVVGQDYPDYWQNNGGNWVLLTNNSGVHIDFAAKMEASALPTVNPNPPYLTNVVSGSNLLLTWGADHIGWKLQVQTNSINVGINTNWHSLVGSSTVNSWSLPINKANGCVFCRLIYP
jgi:hypothetical protein